MVRKTKTKGYVPSGPGKLGLPKPTFRAPDAATNIRIHIHSQFDHRIARVICERLMMKESLTKICKDPRMPQLRTVVRWLADPALPEFREMYYYAKRVAAELLIDEIVEISDDTSRDLKDVYDKDGDVVGQEVNNEAIQRSRVKIDTRKWIAAKMVPRLYGENVNVDLAATGDLAELLKRAANKDRGLPPPIENGDVGHG
jgi:hypothetical protein